MARDSSSTFLKMATLLKARDVATPFAGSYQQDVTVSTLVGDLRRRGRLGEPVALMEATDQTVSQPIITAVCFVPPLPDSDVLSQQAHRVMSTWFSEQIGELILLNHQHFVPGDTTFFEVIDLLAAEDDLKCLVALEDNELIGVVSAADLVKPASRVCLFAMTLDLELAALGLCITRPTECWRALSSKRQKKAEEVLRMRCAANPKVHDYVQRLLSPFGDDVHGSTIHQMALDCTMICDKATMIRKCNLSTESGKLIEEVFKNAEKLRNWCAHPETMRTGFPFPLRELKDLIHHSRYLADAFRDEGAAPSDG